MKKCGKCGENKRLREFYKDKGKRDGLMGQCIKCYRAYDKARSGTESYRARKRNQSKKLIASGYYKRPDVKKRAKAGELARRCHKVIQTCSVDGCNETGERHHPDYDKPLEIVWLCHEHHLDEHRK